MRAEPRFDHKTFLKRLSEAGVDVVLIGRQAMILQGAAVGTVDYDFFISPGKKCLDGLLAVCGKLDYEVMPFGTEDPAKSYKIFLYAGGEKVDIFRAKSYSLKDGGRVTFDEIWKSREKIDLGRGVAVYVPSLECLEKTKRIRLSPKDVEDIKYIRRLLARRMSEL